MDERKPKGIKASITGLGAKTVSGIEEVGNGGVILAETGFWVLFGRKYKQRVSIDAIFVQCMEIGIKAIPIVGLLAATIGAMLAIQSIYAFRIFGAESRVTFGVALSITREFAPLITGILVAGRSGSALAARLGTMKINQEIDALHVMGINPVRFLVVPAVIAMLIMLPCLTIFSDIMGLLAAGLYISADLGISLEAYLQQVIAAVSVDDVLHGLTKSVIFAVLIAVIGVVNGASVQGGAEGVGVVTTRSVVQAITAIVLTDMVFAFMATR